MERAPVEVDTGARGQDYNKELGRIYYMLRFGRAFSGNEKNCCFLNTGGTRFANISSCAGLDHVDDSRSLATTDWDFDGDPDLWMTNRTGPRVRFMRNDSKTDNQFVSLRLQGNGKTTNRDAIGARVEVVTEGNSDLKLVKTLFAGSGFQSQSSKWLSFGLGPSGKVSHVLVDWPGGRQERFEGVKANGFFVLVQATGKADPWTPPRPESPLTPSVTSIPDPPLSQRTIFAAPIEMLELNYNDMQGQPQTAFERDSGQPVLVVLWSTGCKPCGVELRNLGKQAVAFDKAGLKIVALSINGVPDCKVTSTPTEAARILASWGYSQTAGMATDENLRKIQIIQDEVFAWHEPLVTPTSLLIDGQGGLAAMYKGAIDVEKLLQDVRDLSATTGERVKMAEAVPGKWLADPPHRNLLTLASVYHKKGFKKDAAAVYHKVLKTELTDEERGGVHRNLGMIAQKSDEIPKAIEHYETSLKLQPSPLAHNNLAKALESLGRVDDAIEQYQKAVKLDPGYGQVYVNHARLLMELRQSAQALKMLRTAIKAEPGFVESYIYLNQILISFGQKEEAIKILERGLEANPKNAQLEKAIEAARSPDSNAS